MKALKLFLLCWVLLCGTSAAYAQKPKQEIGRVLELQTHAWNQGDLEGFMQGYWQSDSLLFIGKSGLTWGWENTLANYKKGYASPEAMGQLQFDVKVMKPIAGSKAWLVVGKWQLVRSIGNLEGHFSLVWEKRNGKWVIIADHSS